MFELYFYFGGNMKTQKTFSIEERILNDIQDRKVKFGFNFSEWVEDRYTTEFLNIERLEEDYIKHDTKRKEIKNSIKELKQQIKQQKYTNDNLTKDEIKFINTIPKLLKEGKKIDKLNNRFNAMFNKKWSKKLFKETVDKIVNK